jgi:two-component system, response regulator PdtaR
MGNPESLEKAAVLVVDDEAMLRMCAADVLEGEGFEVIEAENADEALKVLANRPDVRVLFTDIQMPGKLDGMDLARKVHQQWPKIKLVITSGRKKPSQAEIPDDGSFIAKPYRMGEVTAEINEQLKQPPVLDDGSK